MNDPSRWTFASGLADPIPVAPGDRRFIPRNIPAQADTNRRQRRALVKAVGSRQFKKLYRKAQE